MTKKDIYDLEQFPEVRERILRGQTIYSIARYLVENNLIVPTSVDSLRMILYKIRNEILGKKDSPKEALRKKKNEVLHNLVRRSPALKKTIRLISADIDCLLELTMLYQTQMHRVIKLLEHESNYPTPLIMFTGELKFLSELIMKIFQIQTELGIEKIKPKESILRIDAQIEAIPPSRREKIRKIFEAFMTQKFANMEDINPN